MVNVLSLLHNKLNLINIFVSKKNKNKVVTGFEPMLEGLKPSVLTTRQYNQLKIF